jgi:RNA polymerase sigma-70 factor, ECF subfamily
VEDLGKPEAATEQLDLSPDHEDALLVSAILRRDRKATAQFVARYADVIYSYVRSRLWPRYEVVNDIVQEIFLAAWENLSQYRGTGPLQAWLIGIARHKVEAYYRAQLRAPESIADLAPDSDALRSARGSDRLEQEQIQKKTWRVMTSLPEQYRLVLLWRYWDKASAREMAERTGKTEKAIERLLARARAEFRERWNS